MYLINCNMAPSGRYDTLTEAFEALGRLPAESLVWVYECEPGKAEGPQVAYGTPQVAAAELVPPATEPPAARKGRVA